MVSVRVVRGCEGVSVVTASPVALITLYDFLQQVSVWECDAVWTMVKGALGKVVGLVRGGP